MPPRPAVDPRAVAMALKAVRKTTGMAPELALIGLQSNQRKALRQGATPIVKRDSKFAERIIARLLDALDGAHNVARADGLRAALRTTFGEVAYCKAVSNRAWERAHDARMAAATRPPVAARPIFGAGTHVAPFLSADGGIVLVTVDTLGRAAFLAECGEPRGGFANIGPNADEFTATDTLRLEDSGEHVLSALRGEHTLKVEGNKVSRYGAPMFGRGIHYAPWRPWRRSCQGFVLVAVDGDNRLVAMMAAETPEGAREARRELLVLLDLLAPESYTDSEDD